MRTISAVVVFLLVQSVVGAQGERQNAQGSIQPVRSGSDSTTAVSRVENVLSAVPDSVDAVDALALDAGDGMPHDEEDLPQAEGTKAFSIGFDNPVLNPNVTTMGFAEVLHEETALKEGPVPAEMKAAAAPLTRSCVPGVSDFRHCSSWSAVAAISAMRRNLHRRDENSANDANDAVVALTPEEDASNERTGDGILAEVQSSTSACDPMPVDAPGTYIKIQSSTKFAGLSKPYFECEAGGKDFETESGTVSGSKFVWQPQCPGVGHFFRDQPNLCVKCILHDRVKLFTRGSFKSFLGFDKRDLGSFTLCKEKSNTATQDVSLTGATTGTVTVQYVANTFGLADDRQTALKGMPVFVFPGVMGTSARMKVLKTPLTCGDDSYAVNDKINAWVPIQQVGILGGVTPNCCELNTAKAAVDSNGNLKVENYEFFPRSKAGEDPWEAAISIQQLVEVNSESSHKETLRSEGYYFKKLFEVYQASGVYKYVNAVPYDWRMNPADANAHKPEYDRLIKRLAQQTKELGLKAQFIGHSMGTLFVLGFLNNVEEGHPVVMPLLKKYFAAESAEYNAFATKEDRKKLLTDRIDHTFLLAGPMIGSTATIGHLYQGSDMLKGKCISDMRRTAQATPAIGALLPTARQAELWKKAAPAEIKNQVPFVNFRDVARSGTKEYTATLNDLLEPLDEIFASEVNADSLKALKAAADGTVVKRPGENPPEVVAKGLLPTIFLYANSKISQLETLFASSFLWNKRGIRTTKSHHTTGDGTVPGVSLEFFKEWKNGAALEEYSATVDLDNGKIKFKDLAGTEWCEKEKEDCEHQGVVANARVIRELVRRGRSEVPQ